MHIVKAFLNCVLLKLVLSRKFSAFVGSCSLVLNEERLYYLKMKYIGWGIFTVRRALPWPPNKHFLQVSQSGYANLIDRHASIKSFNTQLPNENLSEWRQKLNSFTRRERLLLLL